MKTRRPILVCLILLVFTHAGYARDIKTRAGQLYKDVTVSRVEAAGIRITHRDGVAFIDFKDLPAEIQKEFGFDAAVYAAGVAANRERDALAEIQRHATAAALASQQLADQERRQQMATAFTEQQRIAREQEVASANSIQQRDYGSRDYASRDYNVPRYSSSTYSGGSSAGTVHVSGYTRKDGTYVHSYTRRK
jgi:hypothetical protein